jgi:hypothetical protein
VNVLLLRAVAQSYMKLERRRREALINEAKRKHNPSRQSSKTPSGNTQLTPTSLTNSDDEERRFRVRNKTKQKKLVETFIS